MSKLIQETDGRILRLTLNRPEFRNALDDELIMELRTALAEASTEDRIRAVVITGAGEAFSAGADLAELSRLHDASIAANRKSSARLSALFQEIRLHPKVIIARVNGHAIAGGCGLVVACDFAVVSTAAKLGFTEVRIGFVPAIISALVRSRLSDPVLRDLLLTGKLGNASEFQEIGLVTRVVDPGQLDESVDELARAMIESTSPAAITLAKRMLAVTENMPPSAAATYLASFNALSRMTADCRKGVEAFLDKRSAEWAGS